MKFKTARRLKLDFLGKDWKECYLDFSPITIGEFKKGDLLKLAELDTKNPKEVQTAFDESVGILKDHFLGGKGINDSGKKVPIERKDFDELPAEVLGRALDFLARGLAERGKSPSTTVSKG